MAIQSLVAAKKVCELRNWNATNLEVNKILYFASMVFLGRNGVDNPLVMDHFEAWDYGPVLPIVYHKAKAFRNGPIEDAVFRSLPELESGNEADIIAETVSALSDKSAGDLVAITHWEHGAWAKHYSPGAKGIMIPNSDIFQEYRTRVG